MFEKPLTLMLRGFLHKISANRLIFYPLMQTCQSDFPISQRLMSNPIKRHSYNLTLRTSPHIQIASFSQSRIDIHCANIYGKGSNMADRTNLY